MSMESRLPRRNGSPRVPRMSYFTVALVSDGCRSAERNRGAARWESAPAAFQNNSPSYNPFCHVQFFRQWRWKLRRIGHRGEVLQQWWTVAACINYRRTIWEPTGRWSEEFPFYLPRQCGLGQALHTVDASLGYCRSQEEKGKGIHWFKRRGNDCKGRRLFFKNHFVSSQCADHNALYPLYGQKVLFVPNPNPWRGFFVLLLRFRGGRNCCGKYKFAVVYVNCELIFFDQNFPCSCWFA